MFKRVNKTTFHTMKQSISMVEPAKLKDIPGADGAAAHSRYSIQVLAKAMDLLNVLAEARGGLELAELARRLNLPKSSVFRMLVTLEQGNFVERLPDVERYRLGVKLFQLGSVVANSFDVRELAKPFMQQLVETFHETVNLGVLNSGEVIYLDIYESTRSIRMAANPGQRDPVHSTSLGKAMLAFLPKPEIEVMIAQHGMQKYTARTITTMKGFWAELDRVRGRGYSIDDMENELGVRCVGAPIFDHRGQPIAAISVSGPADRMTDAQLAAIGSALVQGTRQIAQRLGFQA